MHRKVKSKTPTMSKQALLNRERGLPFGSPRNKHCGDEAYIKGPSFSKKLQRLCASSSAFANK
ncbi:MAG: hypothetical protein RBU26_10730, partial [Sphaerochaeta sp.]|uniref:hypothetical protein n=1 Tax=Sphaerochaeta sp. TaxID=1972642 RepID=UPI002A364E90